MATNTAEYYKALLGPTEAEAAIAPAVTGGGAGLKSLLGKFKGAKGGLAGLVGYMMLSRLLEARNQSKERGIQREALQAQAGMATPENLYYQAALPQAQEEEAQARQALFSQLSGGVIGPSLPRGYRVIGGQ